MKFKTYDSYVEIDQDWLPRLPLNWFVQRCKYVYDEINERSNDGSEDLLSVSEYYGVKKRMEVIDEGEFLSRAETLEGYKKCKANDLVMNIMLAWKRGLGVTCFNGIVSPAYSVFRLHDVSKYNPVFMHYMLRTDLYITKFKRHSTGVIDSRLRLYPETFSTIGIITPPIEEQIQIATFLDKETAKIDTLIEKQQTLIKLLQEKRQAVISHAVTKGLNPDVPMKDSRTEWLGEVPKHWKLTQVKYAISQIGGGTPSKEKSEYWNGDILWISPKDMKVDYVENSIDKITEQAVLESSTKLIPLNSVLIVVRGMILLHSVPVALTVKPVTINQDMKALIPTKEIAGEYLLYLLKGFRDYILDLVDSSAHGTRCLRTELFERMEIAIPSIEEQNNIVLVLKKKLKMIDSLLDKSSTAIQLLSEQRTTLISSAVTGKIDVRSVA